MVLYKRFLFTLIFTLATVQVFSQEKIIKAEDSLKAVITKTRTDTALITSLIGLGQFYKEQIDKTGIYKDKALSNANRAMKLSESINNPIKKGDSFDLLSRISEKSGDLLNAKAFEQKAILCYTQSHQPDKIGMSYKQLAGYFSIGDENELKVRIKYTNQALQAYQTSGNKIKQGECYQELGDLYMEDGETALSIQNLKQGLAAFNAVHYPKLQGIYYLLDENYDDLGAFEQAIYYGLQAVRVAEAVKDTSSQLCTIYNHVARTYFDMKRQDKAYEYFKYSLKYALINHDHDSYMVVSLNLANSLFILKRYPEALKTLQSIKNATDPDLRGLIYTRLLQLAEKMGNKKLANLYFSKSKNLVKEMTEMSYEKESVYSTLISHLLGIKKYDEVPALLQKYLAVSEHFKSKKDLASIQECLFALDSVKGNYIAAIRHSELARRIKDTLLNEEKNKSISKLEIEYETEKKEHELKIQSANIELLEKKGQLQQASLQKAAIVRNVTIFGVVMLALLLLISNSRYQIKKRNNILLEAQQVVINSKNDALNILVDDKDCLLKEKEWLLKEIHHRVKNNLQIVISLLNSQSAYLNDVEALEALRGSQHRMQSISLIHQKLYQSENLAYIDMQEYICELVEFLKESFDIRKNIQISTDIEPIDLDVSQAVPLGLILNEAVTNAIKYAFTEKRDGKVTIGFCQLENDFLVLTISDNGKGLPPEFDVDNCGSLGMNLIRGLCKQLKGDLSIDRKSGLKIQVTIVKRTLFEQEPERNSTIYID